MLLWLIDRGSGSRLKCEGANVCDENYTVVQQMWKPPLGVYGPAYPHVRNFQVVKELRHFHFVVTGKLSNYSWCAKKYLVVYNAGNS